MAEKITSCARIKPILNEKDATFFKKYQDNTILNPKTGEIYKFGKKNVFSLNLDLDWVFDGPATNEEVFSSILEPHILPFLQGTNSNNSIPFLTFLVSLFAYGQTSSGKTHTMCGSNDKPGLVQLFLRSLFAKIASQKDYSYRVRVSYFEVYNETINDLVTPENKNLELRETSNKVPIIQDLGEAVIQDANEALHILNLGNKSRQTAETNMNHRSSRSHAIFKVMIESRSNKFFNKSFYSTLMLADLAGSEGLKPKSKGPQGTPGLHQRKAEGSAINKSLLALYNVILKLSKGEACPTFRESKLTRILQPVLSGNSRTSIVCTVNPVEAQVSESSNTLRFGIFASKIQTRVKLNEIASAELSGPEADQRKEEMEKLIEKSREYEEENQANKSKVEEIQKSLEIKEEECERLKEDVRIERINKIASEGKIMSLENQIQTQKKAISDLEHLLNQFELFGHKKQEESLEAQCEKLTLQNDFLTKQITVLEAKNRHLMAQLSSMRAFEENLKNQSEFLSQPVSRGEPEKGWGLLEKEDILSSKEMSSQPHKLVGNSLVIEKEGTQLIQNQMSMGCTSSRVMRQIGEIVQAKEGPFSTQCGKLLKQLDTMGVENAKQAKKISELESENDELKGKLELLGKKGEELSAIEKSSAPSKRVNNYSHVTKRIQTSPGKDDLKNKIQRLENKNRKLEAEIERIGSKLNQTRKNLAEVTNLLTGQENLPLINNFAI